jgi:hypothetical protein
VHRILGRAKDHSSLCWLICLALAAALNRADESKVAGAWRACVGEESEVANAHEAFRKHMQQEAAQEFIERKRHQLLFVVVSRIAPAKVTFPSANETKR